VIAPAVKLKALGGRVFVDAQCNGNSSSLTVSFTTATSSLMTSQLASELPSHPAFDRHIGMKAESMRQQPSRTTGNENS
jgi:hypothetical protein